MKLCIDTANVAQIKEVWSWGIVDGVTTNPTHVMKTGRKPEDVYRAIRKIGNGPVSLEPIATDAPTCNHPLTDIGLELFLKDWAKATGQTK